MSENAPQETLRAAIGTLRGAVEPNDGSAAHQLVNLSSSTLSRVKFGLEDHGPDGLGAELAPLAAALRALRDAALEEQLDLLGDENVAWIDTILTLSGVPAPAEEGSLLAAAHAGLAGSIEDRAARFAEDSKLSLNRIYQATERLKSNALEQGGLPPQASADLRQLRRALGALPSEGDRVVLYLTQYIRDVYSFLEDEELLSEPDREELAEIQAFLG